MPALALAACLASLPATAQTCEVKIGAVGPMSDGASAFGLAEKAAAELQAALVNEAGGGQGARRDRADPSYQRPLRVDPACREAYRKLNAQESEKPS